MTPRRLSPPLQLFSDHAIGDVVAVRAAAISASDVRDADALIAQFALDVPVMTGAPRILERRLTEGYTDHRYHEEVPGGDLLFVVAYGFTGDGALFRARPPAGIRAPTPYASVLPDMLVINHLEGATTIAIEPEDLTQVLERPRADPVVDDPAHNERAMMGVAEAMAARIGTALDHLRGEAVAANAELAARIRAMTAAR